MTASENSTQKNDETIATSSRSTTRSVSSLQGFTELIQIATGNRKCLSRILQEKEWRFIFYQAKRQTIAGVLFPAIAQLPKEQQPKAEILLPWLAFTERIRSMNRKMNTEAVRIGKWLNREGMDYTLLKGQGVATFYPQPLLRTPGDFDFWVAPHLSKPLSPSAQRKAVTRFAECHGGAKEVYYHHLHFDCSQVSDVELHYFPSWNDNPWLNYRLQRFYRETAPLQFNHPVNLPEAAGTIHIPTREFNAFYLLLHIFRHLFTEGIGLRQLMDYYYVLQQEWDPETLRTIRGLIRKQHLTKFAGAVTYVLQQVFGLERQYWIVEPNEKEGRFLLKEIMLAGNFGKTDRRIYLHKNAPKIERRFYSLIRTCSFFSHYPYTTLCNLCFRTVFFIHRKINRT